MRTSLWVCLLAVLLSSGLARAATRVLLERALANLLMNAIRYSGEAAAPVVLEARLVGAHVHLRVIDHGRGIPEAQRERLFQPFQRLGDDDTSDGVGLGLAITRGFLDAVGATIDVDDTAGGGLTVTVRLPVHEQTGETV